MSKPRTSPASALVLPPGWTRLRISSMIQSALPDTLVGSRIVVDLSL